MAYNGKKKQRNISLIVVLHLEVFRSPSTLYEPNILYSKFKMENNVIFYMISEMHETAKFM